jgi:hypothetical protein
MHKTLNKYHANTDVSKSGIISAIPNNWNHNIMGETMMHDLICNEIPEKAKEENKPCTYFMNYKAILS